VRDQPRTRRRIIGGIAPLIAAVTTETVSLYEVNSTISWQRAVFWCGAIGSCLCVPNDAQA